MFQRLFHTDVFLPTGVVPATLESQRRIKTIRYSKHLQEHFAMIDDRSHDYVEARVKECVESLKKEPRKPFEVEISKDYRYFGLGGHFLTKYVVRVPYDEKCDLVVVIRPVYEKKEDIRVFLGEVLVATAWLNSRTDNHYTLDESKYCSEEEWYTNYARRK